MKDDDVIKEMQLDLKFQALLGYSIVGMNGNEIEKEFDIEFVHAHPDYSKMMDKSGNLDRSKIIINKDYVIKASDYVRIKGDYKKAAEFSVKTTGVKSCVE